MATAIFYASSTGNTANVAQTISKELGDIETFDIADCGVNTINEYDKLIFGISTWGDGELQDDWEEIIDDFSDIDFSKKTVALFGLGDQDSYSDCFLDAMGLIYEQILIMGGDVIGSVDIDEDFYHNESKAIANDKFVGLALDEDNQGELTDKRIKIWINNIQDKII